MPLIERGEIRVRFPQALLDDMRYWLSDEGRDAHRQQQLQWEADVRASLQREASR
jgi:hypothetical protein